MTLSHIRKNTTILDAYNGYNGIEIGYVTFGQEKFLELSREETIELLDAAGAIVYKDGCVLDENRWISYEDWRMENELTEQDALDCVAVREYAEYMKSITNRIMAA